MRNALLSAALATFAIGCGDVELQEIDDPVPHPGPRPTVTADPSADVAVRRHLELPEWQATLRLRGAKTDGFHAALLEAADLRIQADGADLPFTLERPDVDLAQPGQSWKVATFALPVGAQNVQVVLDFADAAGSFVDAAGAGALTAPGKPIVLRARADLIARSGKVVMELDLQRSLDQMEDGSRELIPFYRVDY